jgi:glutathione peroxidase
MRILLCILLLATADPTQACPPGLDFSARPLLEKAPLHLCEAYAGKVVLVVNTASKCGFTPQYEGLEALYREYGPRGLVVLGFPSNDFANQEPGTEAEIGKFCRSTFGVQFPMFEKTVVRGDSAHPFFRHLAQTSGDVPDWNFHKYLLDRSGRVVRSFGPLTTPTSEKLRSAIEALL